MKTSELPYLSRPQEEQKLQEFLLRTLTPRANTTKTLLLSGERGVGKKSLIQHVLKSDASLRDYQVFEWDLAKNLFEKAEAANKSLYQALFDSAFKILEDASPSVVKTFVALAHIFSSQKMTDANLRQFVDDPKKIQSFVLQQIESYPTLLIVQNFDGNDLAHLESLHHLTEISFERRKAFAILPVCRAEKDAADNYVKKLEYAPGVDSIEQIHIGSFAEDRFVEHITALGLSRNWAQVLYRFSDGNAEAVSSFWTLLQSSGTIVRDGDKQWRAEDDPQRVLTPGVLREWAYQLVQQRIVAVPHETLKIFRDGLLLAAAMGENFLPQIIAEVILPQEPLPEAYRDDEREIEEWEDVWYDLLEREPTNGGVLAISANELRGDARGYFVYAFQDKKWQFLLAHIASNLCELPEMDKIFADSLFELDEALQVAFVSNSAHTWPFRIAINQTVKRFGIADSLAHFYHNQQMLGELAKRVEAEMQRVVAGKKADNLYYLLLWFADVLEETGQYPACLQALQHANELIESKKIQLTELKLAMFLNSFGIAFYRNGRFAEAEPLYHRALAIREDKLGDDNPDVAQSLNNLALLLQDQGKLAEAEPLYRRALAIDEAKLGKDHPDVATDLNNLALLLKTQGKLAEAEPLSRRALDIFEQKLGAGHPNTQTVRENYQALLDELKAQD